MSVKKELRETISNLRSEKNSYKRLSEAHEGQLKRWATYEYAVVDLGASGYVWPVETFLVDREYRYALLEGVGPFKTENAAKAAMYGELMVSPERDLAVVRREVIEHKGQWKENYDA